MTFHHALAFPLLLEQFALGLWGLILGLGKRPLGSSYYTALVVDEGLLVLQSLIGGFVFAGGHRPQAVHFLYGALLVGLLPIVYVQANKRPPRAGLWMGFTLLFMGGLVIRTYFTGAS